MRCGQTEAGGGASYSHSTRRVTGAEAVAPLGRSARQWYTPAWARATCVKARVGPGSTCSRWPFQNQAKVELPVSPRPPGRRQLRFSGAPSGTSSPGWATTRTPAGRGPGGCQGSADLWVWAVERPSVHYGKVCSALGPPKVRLCLSHKPEISENRALSYPGTGDLQDRAVCLS